MYKGLVGMSTQSQMKFKLDPPVTPPPDPFTARGFKMEGKWHYYEIRFNATPTVALTHGLMDIKIDKDGFSAHLEAHNVDSQNYYYWESADYRFLFSNMDFSGWPRVKLGSFGFPQDPGAWIELYIINKDTFSMITYGSVITLAITSLLHRVTI